MHRNTRLVEHGIQSEQSHVRAHVCPVVQRVYVFPTLEALATIETGRYRECCGYQSGISSPTARGYLVPPVDIPYCVAVCLRPITWDYMQFSEADSLRDKGHKATLLVLQMIKNGMFPLPALAQEVDDRELQIIGEDIIIKANAFRYQDIIIQVKCYFPGGERELGGTGNLFLQTAECNPFGIH